MYLLIQLHEVILAFIEINIQCPHNNACAVQIRLCVIMYRKLSMPYMKALRFFMLKEFGWNKFLSQRKCIVTSKYSLPERTNRSLWFHHYFSIINMNAIWIRSFIAWALKTFLIVKVLKDTNGFLLLGTCYVKDNFISYHIRTKEHICKLFNGS